MAPVDGHADRECDDAERHSRAGDTIEPLRLGSDYDECQHKSGAECQQGGFGIAHPLRPRDGETALSRTKKLLIQRPSIRPSAS